MTHQEKKYRVDGIAGVRRALGELGAERMRENESTHYYAQQDGNNVTKLVEHSDRCEIHKLEESDGKFALTQVVPVANVRAGLGWLKAHGFEAVSVVKMKCTDYKYRDGIVGLYEINDFLTSVIIDFPPGEHDAIARELGIQDAEVIAMPYNILLQNMGRLEALQISELVSR